MLTTETYEHNDYSTKYWFDDKSRIVIAAQYQKASDSSILPIGDPFVLDTLTREEALAIAERFALSVAGLHSEMRAELAKMRGGQ